MLLTSTNVICQRGEGSSPAEPIIDPLLSDDVAACARGAYELDVGMGLTSVDLTCIDALDVKKGQVVEVQDSLQGAAYRGVVESVQRSRDGGLTQSRITLLVLV